MPNLTWRATSRLYNIKSGQAVVLLQPLVAFGGIQWYSAVVFEVQRYPYHLLHMIHRINGVNRYIQTGPTGLKKAAAVAMAWNQYALTLGIKSHSGDAKWTKALPGGASAKLQEITTSAWPLCPWKPDGAPAHSFWLDQPEYPPSNQMMGRVILELPNKGFGLYPGQHQRQKDLFEDKWQHIPGGAKTLSVGLDAGQWKIIGTAVPQPNGNFHYMGNKLGLEYIASLPANPANHIPSLIYVQMVTPDAPNLADQAIAVGAVNQQGQLVSPHPGHQPFNDGLSRFQTSRAAAIREYRYEEIPIAPSDLKRYVWITRPRHWVTFRGFALHPSPLPSTVLTLEQQKHTASDQPGPAAKSIVKTVADQATPAGLMLLFRQEIRRGNQADMGKLFYASTAIERSAVRMRTNYFASQEGFGLWAAAKDRFGLAQLQAAGLGDVLPLMDSWKFPTHWKIKGAYATPLLPLPRGVSWPTKGQPMYSLIKKNGLWYLDFSLTKAQIALFNEGMRRSLEFPSRNAKAYHATMRQMQAGKIKDAYALRDALAKALKKYSEPTK